LRKKKGGEGKRGTARFENHPKRGQQRKNELRTTKKTQQKKVALKQRTAKELSTGDWLSKNEGDWPKAAAVNFGKSFWNNDSGHKGKRGKLRTMNNQRPGHANGKVASHDRKKDRKDDGTRQQVYNMGPEGRSKGSAVLWGRERPAMRQNS